MQKIGKELISLEKALLSLGERKVGGGEVNSKGELTSLFLGALKNQKKAFRMMSEGF
jgi:hypothetical protein